MILLIDNYDSFAYNLYQLVGGFCPDIKVVRNNVITCEEIEALAPEAIFLSPGPGKPEDAGICIDVIKTFKGRIPIFGVCLGHQAICCAFGATVSYASQLMHGKVSNIEATKDSVLFQGIENPFPVARYHSLSAVEATLPEELKVTARSKDGEVMAVECADQGVYGVQFHPESVMTPDGGQIIQNFLESIRKQ